MTASGRSIVVQRWVESAGFGWTAWKTAARLPHGIVPQRIVLIVRRSHASTSAGAVGVQLSYLRWGRDWTLLSLKKLINQFKEEISRFEARAGSK